VRAYVDSCIVIYLIEGADALRRWVAAALEPSNGQAPVACFSDLTRLECQVLPMRTEDVALLLEYQTFFSLRELGKIRLEPEVYDLAAELRARHGLKTPDALHLAAALWGGCDELWTNDYRLSSAAGGRIQIRVPDPAV
jgi:predicted nucleic acid-binding protein